MLVQAPKYQVEYSSEENLEVCNKQATVTTEIKKNINDRYSHPKLDK